MNHESKKVHFVIMCLLSLIAIGIAATMQVPQQKSTISSALMDAKSGDTIWVDSGMYREQIYIAPDIVVLSKKPLAAIIDGKNRGTVVTIGRNATLSGFSIQNGTIGVFTAATGASITRCQIAYNHQTGIMCVGNLPRIEDNLIVFNNGSGIQGWDVHTTTASINHNTIAFNSNHGISIGGNSSIILENNIIAFNDQFGIKPSEELVRITMINNVFYQNAKFSDVLPGDNFAFDPEFTDARRFDFSLSNSSRCIGRASDNQNIGSRFF